MPEDTVAIPIGDRDLSRAISRAYRFGYPLSLIDMQCYRQHLTTAVEEWAKAMSTIYEDPMKAVTIVDAMVHGKDPNPINTGTCNDEIVYLGFEYYRDLITHAGTFHAILTVETKKKETPWGIIPNERNQKYFPGYSYGCSFSVPQLWGCDTITSFEEEKEHALREVKVIPNIVIDKCLRALISGIICK